MNPSTPRQSSLVNLYTQTQAALFLYLQVEGRPQERLSW